MMDSMKRIIILYCAVLLGAALLSGCAGNAPAFNPSQSPAATPVQTPAETLAPTPTPLTEAIILQELQNAWGDLFQPDLLSYFPEAFFQAENSWQFFDVEPEERAWLLACTEAFSQQLTESLESVSQELSNRLGLAVQMEESQVSAPSWQLCAAIFQASGSPEAGQAALKNSMAVSAEVLGSSPASVQLSISVEPLPYKEALAMATADEAVLRSAQFLYSYLLTVYDAEMNELEYVQPAPEGSLAEGIVWPLESHTRLRKTWFADRDDGARKHTGTDIWAEADTPIYSCTDGIVTSISTSSGQGNAVIITDPYGYEFHYYHMIRQTDFLQEGDSVSAGELIGHVGNTGNSDRDHLHLSIISPEGLFINPYPYLAAVEP